MEKRRLTVYSDNAEKKNGFSIREFGRMLRANGFKDPSPKINRLQRTYYITMPDMIDDSEGAKSMTLVKPGEGQVDIFKKNGSWVAWVKNLNTGDHDRVSFSNSWEPLLEDDRPGKIKETKALLFGIPKTSN